MGRASDEHEEEWGPVLTVCGVGPVLPQATTSRAVMIAHEASGAKVPPHRGARDRLNGWGIQTRLTYYFVCRALYFRKEQTAFNRSRLFRPVSSRVIRSLVEKLLNYVRMCPHLEQHFLSHVPEALALLFRRRHL
jgi:hypothetical protein